MTQALDGATSVENRVLVILRESLEAEVEPDLDLIGSGVVDSLTFVDLLVRLEEAFSVQIDVETLELDDFRTGRAIAAYLTRCHGVA